MFHYSAETKSQNFEQSNVRLSKEKISPTYHSFGPIQFNIPIFNGVENPIFEILGMELYLDDILIISLIFFLYKEGVKDEMLFIILIMLLLN